MDLTSILESVINAKRIYRDKAARKIIDQPQLLPELVDMVFKTNDPQHIKAAWILELICLENITLLNPHIQKFIGRMSQIKNESALRPVSKICYTWCTYYMKGNSEIFLNNDDLNQIISCNFDWLIEEHKVATQAFAMDTLFLLGDQEQWIHPELQSVLQNNADSESSGYKTRAGKILKNLNSNSE